MTRHPSTDTRFELVRIGRGMNRIPYQKDDGEQGVAMSAMYVAIAKSTRRVQSRPLIGARLSVSDRSSPFNSRTISTSLAVWTTSVFRVHPAYFLCLTSCLAYIPGPWRREPYPLTSHTLCFHLSFCSSGRLGDAVTAYDPGYA